MDISICILTHAQPDLLRACVLACLAEIDRLGIAGEVIIIDNASQDRYPEKLTGLSSRIRIIRNETNLGFAAANNGAIRMSSGRLVLILNDDAILLPDSLRLMMTKVDSDPGIAAAGPKLLNPDGSLQGHFTNRRFPHIRGILSSLYSLEERLAKRGLSRQLLTLDRDPDQSGESEHLAGACLLIRRDALERVGLFDEDYNYWFEDVDLCYRLKKAGWKLVYLAEAHVTHHGSASINKIDQGRRRRMFLESLLVFYEKNRPHMTGLLRLSLALMRGLRRLRGGRGASGPAQHNVASSHEDSA